MQDFEYSLDGKKNEKFDDPHEKSVRPHAGGDLTNIRNPASKNSLLSRKIMFARLYYLYALTGQIIFRKLHALALRFFVDFS